MEKLRNSNQQEVVLFDQIDVQKENMDEYRQIINLPGTPHDRLQALAEMV